MKEVKIKEVKTIRSYKDLMAYQKAYKMSLELHKLTLNFPKFEQFELASQIRRASKSIAMNIAEGFSKKGHTSLAEFKRFVKISLGSNDELRVCLEYCKDLNYIDEDTYIYYENLCIEIGKLLTSMHKNWT